VCSDGVHDLASSDDEMDEVSEISSSGGGGVVVIGVASCVAQVTNSPTKHVKRTSAPVVNNSSSQLQPTAISTTTKQEDADETEPSR